MHRELTDGLPRGRGCFQRGARNQRVSEEPPKLKHSIPNDLHLHIDFALSRQWSDDHTLQSWSNNTVWRK